MTATPLIDSRKSWVYAWPRESLPGEGWQPELDGRFLARELPESRQELAEDSRWPGFFPSPICLVSATDGKTDVLERVVGASIVNRFPYVLAISVCREPLSERHYPRRRFSEVLERGGIAAAQLIAPGRGLGQALEAIAELGDERADERFEASGLDTRRSEPGAPPLFKDAYLVYEARLAGGETTSPDLPPWRDVGSHRIYFLEIHRIELREDIADAGSQIHWRSLPSWSPEHAVEAPVPNHSNLPEGKYTKGYNADYRFPASTTIGFEADERRDGMAILNLPTGVRADEQIEVDDDRARWPCFFPSSVGMITTWVEGRSQPNLMPCGSTTVVSRDPLVITPSISYRPINVRYAPRHTIEVVRRTGRFTCGVPFLDEELLAALAYAGNVSYLENVDKVRDAGFAMEPRDWAPLLTGLPVSYECEVIGEQELGTHAMVYGEVRRILVRADVAPENPLRWCPWPTVHPADADE